MDILEQHDDSDGRADARGAVRGERLPAAEIMFTIETASFWLALGILALQIAGVAFLALFFLRKKFPELDDVGNFLSRWGLWIGFLIALAGSAFSLFYSEVLGIAPCGLCWLQRIFLYPLVFLFALALWKRDRGIADYVIALAIPGALVALYQHYLQMGGDSLLPCPATATEALECNVRFVFEFGYITFPLMSFSLFAFLVVLMLFVRERR